MEASLLDLMSNLNISNKHAAFKQPNIVPYEGILGEWIQYKDFNSNSKTFGFYQCNYCDKTWMSAHSRKGYKQACKNCDRYFNATFLWKNHSPHHEKQEGKKAINDNHKPHRSDLCEACKKGVCNQGIFNKSVFNKGKRFF